MIEGIEYYKKPKKSPKKLWIFLVIIIIIAPILFFYVNSDTHNNEIIIQPKVIAIENTAIQTEEIKTSNQEYTPQTEEIHHNIAIDEVMFGR